MVSRKLLNNVLRNVTAGKEPIPPSTGVPEANEPDSLSPDSLSPAPQQQLNQPVMRKRFYFYEAPPENSINFPSITAILKGSNEEDKKRLINNLKGGYAGEYSAAYFKWQKLIVSTTQYSKDGKKPVVFEVSLNDNGSINGTGDVYPKDSGVTPEMFIKDLNLFTEKGGRIVSIDTSAESMFYNYYKGSPSNAVNAILGGNPPPAPPNSIPPLNASSFNDLFDQYRMYNIGLKRLAMPNGELSTKDGVPGGNYPGGKDAFQRVVGPVLQEMQNKEQEKEQVSGPSLSDEMKKAPDSKSSVFEPVDEQKPEAVKGQYTDKPTAKPKVGQPMESRFATNDPRIKSMARRVLAEFVEPDAESSPLEAAVGMTQVVNPNTSGIGGIRGQDLTKQGLIDTKVGKMKIDLGKKVNQIEQAQKSVLKK